MKKIVDLVRNLFRRLVLARLHVFSTECGEECYIADSPFDAVVQAAQIVGCHPWEYVRDYADGKLPEDYFHELKDDALQAIVFSYGDHLPSPLPDGAKLEWTPNDLMKIIATNRAWINAQGVRGYLCGTEQ